MAGFVVYQDSYIGATIVSNRFIDEYMTDANDAQLKVYLYLVRMLNAHLETSVSDIADRFNHTEKDVLRAFKYWEKKGLLTIDYDEKGALSGVHLVNLCNGESKVPSVEATHKKIRVAKQKEAGSGVPTGSEALAGSGSLAGSEALAESEALTENESRSASLVIQTIPSIVGSSEEIKYEQKTAENVGSVGSTENISIIPRPVYSMKELKDFSKSQGCTIVSLAEVYFGRPLTPGDLQILCYMTDGLGMSEDLVDYLLQYCADKGKKDFRYAEKVAIGWKEKNITTVDQASGNSLKYDKIVYTIMNRLGKSGSPTDKEMEFISRWLGEYAFPDGVILEACDRTVLATDSHRFQYAEGILNNWSRNGITSLEDVARMDENYQKKEQSKGNTASSNGHQSGNRNGGGNAGSFGKFQQNDIDYEALAKKIFVN